MWCPVVFFHDLRGKSLDFSTETIQQHDFAPAGGEKHIGGPDAFGQRRGGDIYPVKHAEKLWSIGTDPPSWRIFHSYSLVYWEVPLNMFDLGIPETSQGCVDFLGRIFPLEADRKVKRLKSELESEKAGARTNENWLVLTGTME